MSKLFESGHNKIGNILNLLINWRLKIINGTNFWRKLSEWTSSIVSPIVHHITPQISSQHYKNVFSRHCTHVDKHSQSTLYKKGYLYIPEVFIFDFFSVFEPFHLFWASTRQGHFQLGWFLQLPSMVHQSLIHVYLKLQTIVKNFFKNI